MALVVNLAFTAFLPLLWIIGDSHLLRFKKTRKSMAMKKVLRTDGTKKVNFFLAEGALVGSKQKTMNLFLIDLQSFVLQLISVLLDFFLQVWILTSVPTPPYLLLKVEFSNLDIYVQIVFVKYIYV